MVLSIVTQEERYPMLELNTEMIDLEQRPVLLDSGCRRSNTVTLRYLAVQRAISLMHKRFMDQLTLPEIADAAQLSPFHFNRVFRSMIGVVPTVFLAAIRMKEAKNLLLTTQRSVTDICFDVGYTSLGTFTSRFTLLVGLSPSRFRQLAQEEIMRARPEDLRPLLNCFQSCQGSPAHACFRGAVHTTTPFNGLIFVGMFPTPLPQGRPTGCAILTSPGLYTIPYVPDGEYNLWSAALDQSQDLLSVLATGPRLQGDRCAQPVQVRNGRALTSTDITLAPPSWADPPIVIAFPWLFVQYFHQYNSSTA
jgi:AraC family transcriptional regulator